MSCQSEIMHIVICKTCKTELYRYPQGTTVEFLKDEQGEHPFEAHKHHLIEHRVKQGQRRLYSLFGRIKKDGKIKTWIKPRLRGES